MLGVRNSQLFLLSIPIAYHLAFPLLLKLYLFIISLISERSPNLTEPIERSEDKFNAGLRIPPFLGGTCLQQHRLLNRSVAQPGSAPEWGSGGRGFKSLRSDTEKGNLGCLFPCRPETILLGTHRSCSLVNPS